MKKLLILLFMLSSAVAFAAASGDSDAFGRSRELYNQAVQDRNFERIFAHHAALRRFDLKSAYQESQSDEALLKLIADTKPTDVEHQFLSNILNLFPPQSPIYRAVRNQNWQALRNEIERIEQLAIQAQEANEKTSAELTEEENKEPITWSPWKVENTLRNKCRIALAQHPERVLAALPMLHAHGGCAKDRFLLPALCINNALIRKIGMQTQILTSPHSIFSIAFSPDGSTLALALADETVCLWDVHAGRGKSLLRGHTDCINSIAFSPDSNMLASASRDKTVRLWDAHAGCAKSVLHGHRGYVNSVAFSPDGNTLASGSDDDAVRLWDIHTGCEKSQSGQLQKYVDSVSPVAFSPDSNTLAFGFSYGSVYLWNAYTDCVIRRLDGHHHKVSSIAFSPDGNMLASASCERVIYLWDVHTDDDIGLQGHRGSIASVAFSPDGKTLASGSLDKTIRLWDTQTGCERGVLNRCGLVDSVAFSPDGSTLVSVEDKTVHFLTQYTQQLCTVTNQHEQVFLLNAIRDWDERKPHIVAPENRVIYESLIERFVFLKNPQLFETKDA